MKNKPVDVIDLNTMKVVTTYMCSPMKAVANAYRQLEKGDWNTWNYKEDYSDVPMEIGRWHYVCGKFAVRKEENAG